MQEQRILDDNRIGRLMLKLSIPAFIGMMVMTLYNVVDTIFIGHYVGALGIAGLSIVFPFQMLALGVGQMTGMGGGSLVSRSIGAGNRPRAEKVLGNVVTSTFVLSGIIMIVGLINPDFWLRLMGSSETILPYARDYLIIILIGNIAQTFAMTLNMLVTAEGSARTAMVAMILGAVVNIILDAVFIIPLGAGIKGAAWATVISQVISVGYLLRYFYKDKNSLKIYFRNMAIEWKICMEILAVGIASLARMFASSISAVFINRMLVVYGGDLAVSTFGIMNRMLLFAILPGIVIGQGLQPILGFNYGAKRFDKALRSIRIAIIASSAIGIVVFVILYFFPQSVIRVFTSDADIISLASQGAKNIFLAIYLVGFLMVGSTLFQALGKAGPSFITSVSRSALFLIPLVLILPQFWQLDGIWLAFPIADALTFMLTVILFIPQIKELQKMDRNAAVKKLAEI
jgi:putative MATE family efflux protein